VVVDGELTPAQLVAAQTATRPAKPESLAWETSRSGGAPTRGLVLDRERALGGAQRIPGRARVAALAARIDKAAFTRRLRARYAIRTTSMRGDATRAKPLVCPTQPVIHSARRWRR
jgi:hypothetical protein